MVKREPLPTSSACLTEDGRLPPGRSRDGQARSSLDIRVSLRSSTIASGVPPSVPAPRPSGLPAAGLAAGAARGDSTITEEDVRAELRRAFWIFAEVDNDTFRLLKCLQRCQRGDGERSLDEEIALHEFIILNYIKAANPNHLIWLCGECEHPLVVPASEQARKKHVFCSRDCHQAFQRSEAKSQVAPPREAQTQTVPQMLPITDSKAQAFESVGAACCHHWLVGPLASNGFPAKYKLCKATRVFPQQPGQYIPSRTAKAT